MFVVCKSRLSLCRLFRCEQTNCVWKGIFCIQREANTFEVCDTFLLLLLILILLAIFLQCLWLEKILEPEANEYTHTFHEQRVKCQRCAQWNCHIRLCAQNSSLSVCSSAARIKSLKAASEKHTLSALCVCVAVALTVCERSFDSMIAAAAARSTFNVCKPKCGGKSEFSEHTQSAALKGSKERERERI